MVGRLDARRAARRSRATVAAAGLALAAMATLSGSGAAAVSKRPELPPGRLVDVQLLALNDFHGALEPPSGSSGRIGTFDAGGVEYLATHVAALRATNPNTLVLSAGDLIGASPLLSALFHDEPTIEAMNALGLDLNAVGNHEFDEGVDELLRMQNGGCHPIDGCLDGDGFGGARFGFLAANVVRESDGSTLFPPYAIRNFQGAKVAIIGMTLEGTPSIVPAAGTSGLAFRDEADTVNDLLPELEGLGVDAIVVLVHEGGVPTGGYNACPGISGPIVDIVDRLDDSVDIVVSGHTHQAYNCVIDNKIVTSAASNGRLVTDIDFTVDKAAHDVVAMRANNLIVERTVPKDGTQTELIDRYKLIAGPIAARPVGSITADITLAQNSAGESALGDVIADAQLAATAGAGNGNAVVAFMNPGGIRRDLLYPQSTAGEGDGVVTYGEAFAVQPFGNSLVTMTLTGAQIDTLLEQQWAGQPSPRILQVSSGFTYTWNATQPVGSRVAANGIAINGVVVNPASAYRVAVNSFLAEGGDKFLVLQDGTDRRGGVQDLDALLAYFGSNSPVAPGPMNRISRIG